MLKYCILVLCAFAALSESATISTSNAVSPFGIVEGITSCGSAGQIRQVRVTDCTRVPCQAIVGNTYTIEIDFVPSQSHASLNLKVLLIHQGVSHTIVDGPVAGSAVEAGRQYTFTYNMPITAQFMGPSDLRIEIQGGAVVELCGLAGLNVVAGLKQIATISSTAIAAPFGIVEGVTSCGSAGQIRQVRVTDCTRVPCQAVVGRTYTIEMDFVPSSSHASLNLKVIIIHQGTSNTIIDAPVPGSAVEAGLQYTFTYNMPITAQFMGLSDLRIEIQGGAVVELCGLAGLNVVPAAAPKQITQAAIVSRAVSRQISPFGIVEGIASCGSAGQIRQVRVTDCTRVPCQAVVGNTYTIEIDFVPSQSHAGLNLKVLLIHQGVSHTIVDGPVAGSAVEAGRQYTFTYNMPISAQFMGPSDLRIEIQGGAVVELCGLAGLNVVA